MTTTVQVPFADGETAVVGLDFKSHAVIDLVVRGWGLLYPRGVIEWKPTSAVAEFWYDGQDEADALQLPFTLAWSLRPARWLGKTVMESAAECGLPRSRLPPSLRENR